jgi:hypothetical protein
MAKHIMLDCMLVSADAIDITRIKKNCGYVLVPVLTCDGEYLLRVKESIDEVILKVRLAQDVKE